MAEKRVHSIFSVRPNCVKLFDERLHRAAVDPDDLVPFSQGATSILSIVLHLLYSMRFLSNWEFVLALGPQPAWGLWERLGLRKEGSGEAAIRTRKWRRGQPGGRWPSRTRPAPDKEEEDQHPVRTQPGNERMMAKEPRLAPTRSIK